MLECVIDPIDGIFLHTEQETRTHLRIGRSGIEERGRGMREEPLGEEGVGLEDAGDVIHVHAHRDTHEHVLRTFGNDAVNFQQIGFFEGFESKVVKFKVTVVNDGSVKYVLVLLYDEMNFFGDESGGCARFGV